jgi:hypothetical protein
MEPGKDAGLFVGRRLQPSVAMVASELSPVAKAKLYR